MVFKSQTAFALALMCMTSLSTLQAGGGDDNPDSSKSVTQSQKTTFKINEYLVIGGLSQHSNFTMQLHNSPDLRVGHAVALSASQEEVQKLCSGLVATDVLVFTSKIERQGPLFEKFGSKSQQKGWGYGILSFEQSEALASPEILNLMRLMKEAGLDVTLRGNLNYPKNIKKDFAKAPAELLVVGIKPLKSEPVKVEPVVEVPAPVVKVETPKTTQKPVVLDGQEIGKLNDSSSKIASPQITIEVDEMSQYQRSDYEKLAQTKPTSYNPMLEGQLKGKAISSQFYNPNAPEASMPVLRRTWSDYVKSLQPNEEPAIVFFSGHKGAHTGIGGTDQSERYYMVDSCSQFGDVEPDYIFFVPRSFHPETEEHRQKWSYWPDNSVGRIVLDDRRFMDEREFSEIWRILKKGGTLEFSEFTGFPSVDYSSNNSRVTLSESGTNMSYSNDVFISFAQGIDESVRAAMTAKRQALAKVYYAKFGFSDVKLEKGLFKLVK